MLAIHYCMGQYHQTLSGRKEPKCAIRFNEEEGTQCLDS